VLHAQDEALFIQRNANEKIAFARFSQNENSERRVSNEAMFLRQKLQMKEGDELRLIRERTDELGITTKRFQQYYRGVKVENAQYLSHSRNGFIEVINGDFHDVNLQTVEPRITEEQALLRALEYVGIATHPTDTRNDGTEADARNDRHSKG
jgi:Zn-dependent metalloprotease